MKKPLGRFAYLVILLAAVSSTALAERRERLIDGWRPVHFDVSLVFNDSLSELASVKTDITVTVQKKDLVMIDLDFGKMPVKSVLVDGSVARFAQHDDKLDIYLAGPTTVGQNINISVEYSGKPLDGLILVKDADGLPSAIGDNWPDRVHNWIPCFDHPSAKASVRFTVTASSRNSVVANGKLESRKENSDSTTTWVWSEKNLISPYNMVVAAGQFATAELKTKAPIPISYYVTQSDRKHAEQGFSPAGPAVTLFGDLVEPYPYEKLALVVGATKFGGMENANTIVFAPNLFNNFLTAKPRSPRYDIPAGVETVVAHEIAHQWFGDSVTEATWADLWLSEGFATYFAGLFVEKTSGPVRFRSYMRDNAKAYLEYEKRKRTPIHDTETEKLLDLLNPNNYEKGAWVLHSLRGMLGDVVFLNGLKQFYQSKKSGLATSEDLRIALEKASGRDLKDYFERWVYKSGHPIYKVSWTPARANSIDIKLEQTQPDDAFLTPVTLEVVTAKGAKRIKIVPTGKESSMRIRSAQPHRIVVDPDEFILKEVVE